MALWHCTTCTTAYAVGASCCPHCGCHGRTEEPVPKIHKGRGVTDAAVPPPAPEPAPEPEQPRRRSRHRKAAA